jgi:hypothetical protein
MFSYRFTVQANSAIPSIGLLRHYAPRYGRKGIRRECEVTNLLKYVVIWSHLSRLQKQVPQILFYFFPFLQNNIEKIRPANSCPRNVHSTS